MSETIAIQQINTLRNELKKYLRAAHSEWSDNTILTTNSDAIFALNNNVGVVLPFQSFAKDGFVLSSNSFRWRKDADTHWHGPRHLESLSHLADSPGFYSSDFL